MTHALLSPSSAERWMHCPPSARAEEQKGDTESAYAAEGSLAHAIAETVLKGGRGAKKRLETLKTSPYYYKGMEEEIAAYVDFCRTEQKKMGADTVMQVEETLDLSSWVPEGFGTGDCILISPTILHIIDLKFGKGVVVSPVENKQLMLYALGALEANQFIYDGIETVKMTIAQVRLGEIHTYTMTVKDLLAWGDSVKPRAVTAYKGEGRRCAGGWCRFCKVKTTCRSYTEWVTGGVDSDIPPEELLDDEIALYLQKADNLMEWAKDLKAYALEHALAGTTYEGWKVVAGRGVRKITDPEGLAKRLREEGLSDEAIYKPREMEGITALTRLMGKKAFDEAAKGFIEKPQGKPTLVPESDKRPPIAGVESEFTFMEE